MEGIPALAIVGYVSETFAQADALGNPTRSGGKHRSLSHSYEHMSPDMVDHVRSNNPESSFPGRLYIFEDNEAVIRMILKGRSPFLRHVPRTHRVDFNDFLKRIKLDSSISIRHVCTTETIGRHVDHRCVHDHSMEVSAAVVRYSSTI